MKRLAYARCFIEISAKTSSQRSVSLEIEGGEKVSIDVKYEWLPPTYEKYHTFGQRETQCPIKETWLPKDKP